MDFTADFSRYGRRSRHGSRGGEQMHHEGRGRHGGRGGHGWEAEFGKFGHGFGGFGSFGGFGGFPFGPPRGKRSRASRGDIRLAVLALLSEQPMHGYQLMREISARSDGVWRPSPGAVYPALQQLQDESLIEQEQGAGKRVFGLTDAGRGYVAEHQQEIDGVWQTVGADVDDDWMELANTSRQIVQAFFQVVTAGDPRQVAEAKELLIETRRKLYRILAEDEPETGTGTEDETETETETETDESTED